MLIYVIRVKLSSNLKGESMMFRKKAGLLKKKMVFNAFFRSQRTHLLDPSSKWCVQNEVLGKPPT